MLKENSRSLSNFQKLVDIFCVVAAWWISYFLRFETQILDSEANVQNRYFKWSLLLIVTTIYYFYNNKLYNSMRFSSRFEEILSLVKANFSSFITFIIFIYFFGDIRISRITLGLFFIISSTLLIIFRISIRNYLRSIRTKGRNLRYLLILGDGPQAKDFYYKLKQFKDSGLKIKYWNESNGLSEQFNIPTSSKSSLQIIQQNEVDAVVLAYSLEQNSKLEDYLNQTKNELIHTLYLPEFRYSFVGLKISDFSGLPIIELNQPNFNSFHLFIKRMLDITLSLIGLILLLPILLIISILVKLTSTGPIFYGQKRIGLDGNVFTMWKFRSMRVNAQTDEQPGWTTANDPRKTAFGSFIRKTSLDELPQLWNVVIGNMSLVGPRPEQPHFVSKFKHEIPSYMLRHKMKAGITGWAQVNGWRGDTSIKSRIECDIYYITNWTLWLDIKIIFLTFWKGFINKNAY